MLSNFKPLYQPTLIIVMLRVCINTTEVLKLLPDFH